MMSAPTRCVKTGAMGTIWHRRPRARIRPALGRGGSVLNAFARLVSNPRVCPNPMPISAAWGQIEEWLSLTVTFTPEPTQRHREVLDGLVPAVTRAELFPDAHLAALAMEYGLVLCSSDTDYDRFPGLAWRNPLVG